MGCPDIYYKKSLQYFAYGLLYMKNTRLANMWLGENDTRKLEEFILEKKEDYNEKTLLLHCRTRNKRDT